ncbi:thioredoxin [Candidatus Parcubacteria bacterium]|nr:MAG: thioredoxin [Candidatus Parcubacteria bacterium]
MTYKKGIAPLVIIMVLAVVAVGGVGWYLSARPSAEDFPALVGEENAMMDKEGGEMMAEKEGETMMKKEGEAMSGVEATDSMMEKLVFSGNVIAGNMAPLIDFNKADYEKALASNKLIVLYFYATWCPICRAEVSTALYPAFNDLKTDKVVGFRVNYNDSDTDNDEKDLARQHGVAYQHTKVFVQNGQRIFKSPESWSKTRYFEEINKVLTQ